MQTVTVGQKQRIGMTDFNGKEFSISVTRAIPDDANLDDIELEIAQLLDMESAMIKEKAKPFLPFAQLSYVNADHMPPVEVQDLFMGKPVEHG